MENFQRDLYRDIAKFLLWFGGFWVIFCLMGLLVINIHNDTLDYIKVVSNLGSLIYLGKIFYDFRRDLLKKVESPEKKFIRNYFYFSLDLFILIIFAIPQIKATFSGNTFTVEMFISYSSIFLAVFFDLFRVVYSFLEADLHRFFVENPSKPEDKLEQPDH